MKPRLATFFTDRYDKSDYVISQKVKVVSLLCNMTLFFVVLILVVNNTTRIWNLGDIIPWFVSGCGFFVLVVMALYYFGHYVIGSHVFISGLCLSVWATMFVDNPGHPLPHLDTIAYIFFGLGLIPLVLHGPTAIHLFYYIVNLSVFLGFIYFLRVRTGYDPFLIYEYAMDSFIGLISCSFISYHVYKINRDALHRAGSNEKKLQKEKDFSETIITRSPILMCSVTGDGVIRSINPICESVTGYGAGALIGRDFSQLFISDRPVFECFPQTIRHEFQTFRQQTWHRTRDNTIRWIDWDVVYQNETVNGRHLFLCFGQDVTQKKRAEDKILSLNRDLEDRVEKRTLQLEKANQRLTQAVDQTRLQVKETEIMNSDNSKRAGELSSQAVAAAVDGTSHMQDMTLAMDEISRAGDKIATIIKTIDDIAFQTNLLALNASMEAARAGKHGKGFAVVAQEVRNLAERSASAAHEITQLVEESVAMVENGTQIARKTSTSLDDIQKLMQRIDDLVTDITSQTNQQVLKIAAVSQSLLQ